ncbi:MAG: hypothetical protein ACI83D_000283 [Planctomycetota bacterium]|jgi:hypothetical protein
MKILFNIHGSISFGILFVAIGIISLFAGQVYAYELDSNECLVDFETFDAGYDVCVFEPICDSDTECERIEAEYDAALEDLDLYFEQGDGDGGSPDGGFEDSETISEYRIEDAGLVYLGGGDPDDSEYSYAFNEELHQQMWEIIRFIMPERVRSRVDAFIVETDGEEGTLAAVEISEGSGAAWSIYVDAVDVFKKNGKYHNKKDFLLTLVHEFAHIMTLDETQIEIVPELLGEEYDVEVYEYHEARCQTFFTGEGCAKTGSYIAEFVDAFWSEDMIEEVRANEDIEDVEEYDELALEFYESHEDSFLTEYAATNPGEDIAETWSLFITQPKPETYQTIADQKLQFFYTYDPLVVEREHTRARLQQIIDGTYKIDTRTDPQIMPRSLSGGVVAQQRVLIMILLRILGVDEVHIQKLLL